MNFVVTVVCAVHIVNCPIPGGYHSDFRALSKEECEQRAKKVVSAFGYPVTDYKVTCKEK